MTLSRSGLPTANCQPQGLFANYLKVVPSIAIAFVTYEQASGDGGLLPHVCACCRTFGHAAKRRKPAPHACARRSACSTRLGTSRCPCPPQPPHQCHII